MKPGMILPAGCQLWQSYPCELLERNLAAARQVTTLETYFTVSRYDLKDRV